MRWELDRDVQTSVVMDPAGDVYQRHPDMDGPQDRAWVHVPSVHPTAASGVHVEPQQGRKHLTLADLRNLVTTAERMGHKPDATVYGTVAWRGQLLRAGIKAAGEK
jgi:hypothetical protein